jgi:hypothetical protein
MATKRVRLIEKLKSFLETEMIRHVGDWDYIKMQRHENVVTKLNARIPKITMPKSRLSNQRKLFY